MSRIAVVCPTCGREGKLPEAVKTLPKAVRCPGCQNQFRPVADSPERVVVPNDVDETSGGTDAPKTGIKPLWVGLAIFLFWPLGLVLLWSHPRLSHRKAWWGVGGIWSFIILLGWMSDKDKRPSADKPAIVQGHDAPSTPEMPPTPKGEVPSTDQDAVVLEAPEGAHPLGVNVGTAVQVGNLGQQMGNRLNSLLRVKAYRTDNQIILDVDVDKNKWPRCPYWLPLLVRLADEDGQYLTHFETSERFTASPEEYNGLMKEQRSIFKLHLLKPSGNRFVYGVNRRDLRDTAIVEVGFFDDGEFFNIGR